MTTSIITDPMEVFFFVKKYVPLLAVERMNALGFKRNGELTMGVLYQYWTPKSVWMHVAADPAAAMPMNGKFLRLAFEYPFIQVGVSQALGMVDASNAKARAFDENIGFKPVSLLPDAGTDGGDLIIYSLRKEDCRFIRRKEDSNVSVAHN